MTAALPQSFNEFYQRRIPHEERAALRARMAAEVLAGATIFAVAKCHKVSPGTVRRGLGEAGIGPHELPRKNIGPCKVIVVAEMLVNPKKTMAEIAEKAGCSKQYVHQVRQELAKHGYVT